MYKVPVVIAIVAVGLVVGLNTLPRSVVEDGDETLETTSVSVATDAEVGSDNNGGEAHINSLTAQQRSRVDSFKAKIEEFQNTDKYSIFADSLADAYFEYAVYDSAGWYAAQVAEENPGIDTWTKAGRYYYQAFGFAVSTEDQAKYAVSARQYLQQVADANPSDVDVAVELAMTFVVGDNPMQGILGLREIAEENPTHVGAQFNLGMLSRQSGQHDKAIERFQNVIDLEPTNLQARYFMALSHLELGDNEEARMYFEQILKATDDPVIHENVEAYLNNI